jgi:hypothetical protein
MHYGETAFGLMQASVGRRSHASFGKHLPFQSFLVDVLIHDAIFDPPGAPRRPAKNPPYAALLIVRVIIEEFVCPPILLRLLLSKGGFFISWYPAQTHQHTIVLL